MVVDHRNDIGYGELRLLDGMKRSSLWMIRTILDHELIALNVMNNLGLWMT